MTPLLLRIAAAAFLSLSSLIVVLFRVSPLTSPGLAVPFFFLTIFLTVASLSTLLCYAIWGNLSVEGMDAGRKISISLREGLFLATATVLLFVFQIFGILTWWIAGLIYLVFILIEVALHS
ncbi:hypothetical protein EXS65_02465 [Candidatus Peribacteria bacterium]|nr:hypothetical protein [Candidatus Peribacteria bacterium]